MGFVQQFCRLLGCWGELKSKCRLEGPTESICTTSCRQAGDTESEREGYDLDLFKGPVCEIQQHLVVKLQNATDLTPLTSPSREMKAD